MRRCGGSRVTVADTAALVPGLTLCAACRDRDAVLTVDAGERWARPLCFDCAEDLIERENAIHISRKAVNLIHQAQRGRHGS